MSQERKDENVRTKNYAFLCVLKQLLNIHAAHPNALSTPLREHDGFFCRDRLVIDIYRCLNRYSQCYNHYIFIFIKKKKQANFQM